MKCNYRHFESDGALCLVDEGGVRSLTNSIEDVIEELKGRGIVVDRTMVYRDSEGVWDGVAVVEGEFGDFVLLGARSHEEAIRKFRDVAK